MTNTFDGCRQPTVLCVDDDECVLRSLERSLRRLGCRVLLAASGRDALELLEQDAVDVLISDEAMPGLTGTEVLRLAKEISPATVRILLTAHCNDSEVVIRRSTRAASSDSSRNRGKATRFGRWSPTH